MLNRLYPHSPGHRGVETSAEASVLLAPSVGRLQQAALNAVKAAGAAGLAATFDPCDADDPQGMSFLPGYKPNVPHYAAPVVMVPPVDLETLLGREMKVQEHVDTIEPATEGFAMVEVQRATPVKSRGEVQYLIGGFAELTTVRRDGITRQILTEWPEDRIGMPVAPAGAIPIDEARSIVEQIEKLQTRLTAFNQPRALAA